MGIEAYGFTACDGPRDRESMPRQLVRAFSASGSRAARKDFEDERAAKSFASKMYNAISRIGEEGYGIRCVKRDRTVYLVNERTDRQGREPR